ncbi:MAG: AAA family ATPase [Armatimonadetes bacterium]|nr:AAA family ATPase [Armatimonadota bacterium]NOG92915.1 AAA family ATPase [Armatimonadota bacterium]
MNSSNESARILDEILAMVKDDNPRLRNYLFALQKSLESDERRAQEMAQTLAEYEDAYQKLTAPANRTGVFLDWIEAKEIALVAVGDSEFVVSVDPKIDAKDLKCGSRVKVNDAYAVIGTMPPHPGGQVMKVAEVLGKDRLKVSQDPQGAVGRVVKRADSLAKAGIQVGDEVRIEPNFKVAVEHYPQQAKEEYFFEEVPEISWDQVGGQHEAIQLIRETIEGPLLHPELYRKFDKKPIKGILLFGPPGCGKTLIGKAIAHNLSIEYGKKKGKEVKEYFMHISGPRILNMWLGETERMVREIFQTARERAKEGRLVFIFFDEAESVLRTRSSGRWLNISNTVVPQFCAELDGLVSLENVVLILTSNRPDYIDPAILRPERIDRKVKIRRPDRDATREIFSIYLHDALPLDPDAIAAEGGDVSAVRDCLLDTITSYLWRTTEETEFVRVFLRTGTGETLHWKDLVSGALIKSVVDRAKDIAIKRAIAEPSKPHGIRLDDLKEAIRSEYRENEIFPKSDSLDDWLKLLDIEESNVAAVKPIRDADRDVRGGVI